MMKSPSDFAVTIILHVAGANAVDLARGVEAAEAAFWAAGITPWTAALSTYARERWEFSEYHYEFSPTRAQLGAAAVMDHAEHVALMACCDGWTEIPRGAFLQVTPQSS